MTSSTELTVFTPAARPLGALILAHGAGAGQKSGFMVRIARALSQRGLLVATFDFPYIRARRRVPDKAPVLEDAWRDAIGASHSKSEFGGVPLFIGGKSMGGRMASHIASQGVEGVRGIVFLGYPLHPPGKPQQRRDAHLPAIKEPMLFVQGERDQFGTGEEIRGVLPQLNPQTTLHVVAAGDHSFKVPAKTGASADDVFEEVVGVVVGWIRKISGGPAAGQR